MSGEFNRSSGAPAPERTNMHQLAAELQRGFDKLPGGNQGVSVTFEPNTGAASAPGAYVRGWLDAMSKDEAWLAAEDASQPRITCVVSPSCQTAQRAIRPLASSGTSS